MPLAPNSVTVVTPPASEPVSLEEAKHHCRVETDADDDYIETLITVARRTAETYTQRYLITQTLDARFEEWPLAGDCFYLPGPPTTSVTSVKYIDVDGVEQTWSSAQYQTDIYSEPARVIVRSAYSYPILDDVLAPITVRYVSGYANAAAVPETIKQGMLLMIGEWYKHRENIVTGTIVANLPDGAKMLFDHECVPWGY